jgi:hypothetical protein
MADLTAGNLQVAEKARPEIIVDGLGPINPELAASRYRELHMDRYNVAGHTKTSVVYVIKR